MKVKAKVSFAGTFSMYKGEIKECSDKAMLQSLLKCKYVEEVKEPEVKNPAPKKGGNKNAGKRDTSK